jgi:glucose-6-phosphate isomerase
LSIQPARTHVFADLSKNLLTAPTEAAAAGPGARDAAWSSTATRCLPVRAINTTEHRAVMHGFAAQPGAQRPALADGRKNIDPEWPGACHAGRHAGLCRAVRADAAITDVVNIGIGGSDLGPQMAVLALDAFAPCRASAFTLCPTWTGMSWPQCWRSSSRDSTLFLIASKTFTTIETMTNAHSAKAWFDAAGRHRHCAALRALTTNVAAAGLRHHHHLRFLGLGGRALFAVVGHRAADCHRHRRRRAFRDLLAGAHAMDEHFRTAPLEQNLPVRLGCWTSGTATSTALAAAASRRTTARCAAGRPICSSWRWRATASGWTCLATRCLSHRAGAVGRARHQRAARVFPDAAPGHGRGAGGVCGGAQGTHALAGHHDLLLANVLAQAQALMVGQADAGGHRHFPGQPAQHAFVAGRADPAAWAR